MTRACVPPSAIASIRSGLDANPSGHARARRSSIDARDDDDDDDGGDGGDLRREVGASRGDASRRGREWDKIMRWAHFVESTRASDESVLASSKKVAIMGGGSFGTAMATLLARNKGDLDVVILMRNAGDADAFAASSFAAGTGAFHASAAGDPRDAGVVAGASRGVVFSIGTDARQLLRCASTAVAAYLGTSRRWIRPPGDRATPLGQGRG